MVSRRFRRTLFVAVALCALFCVAAFGQKVPVNKQGKVISIAAVDFPQFQPYKVRTESEKKAADDYGIKYTLIQPPQVTTEGYVEARA